DPDPLRQGGSGTYTLSVSNHGDGAATSTVTVTDSVPSAFTVTNVDGGSTWNCSATSGNDVSCSTDTDLAAPADPVNGPFPAYEDIDITVTVDAHAPSTVTNTGKVFSPDCAVATPGDPCDTDDDPTSVDQNADLRIAKSHDPDPLRQGGTGTYTLSVSNHGDGAATSTVTVTDSVPSAFTVTNVDGGSTWDCTATSGNDVS